jgi:TolB-like protein
LWPESPADTARHSLANAVYRLRKELGEACVQGKGDTLFLNPEAVRADVMAFETHLERGELEEAVALYRGPLLEGFHLKGSNEFEDWRSAEARRLGRRFEEALEALASRAEGEGKWREAAGYWERLSDHDPFNTRLALGRMRALAAAGDPGNAIQVGEEHARTLREELGAEAPLELTEVLESLRFGRTAAAPGVLRGEIGASRIGPDKVAAPPGTAGEGKPRRGRAKAVIYSGAALLGLGVVVALAARRFGGPDATSGAETRIVVAWFDNHTGDETLADVGSLAAEWIADGLSRQGVARVIAASAVRELMRGDLSQAADHSRQLAARTRAAVLVTGRYDRRGDSLEYRAEVLELGSERVLATIGPIRGFREETSALDGLVEQVYMVLDTRRRTGSRVEWSRPRSLQAYREYSTGFNEYCLLRRWMESVPYFDRAIALDSLWLLPRIWVMRAFGNLDDYQAADSVRALAQFAREQAPVADQLHFDWVTAGHDGDHERQYRIGQRLLEMDSTTFLYHAAQPTARIGRAREVLRYAALRDTVLDWSREWRGWDNVHLWALHALGEFQEELDVARQNVARRGLDPQTAMWMARPLAAMGRSDAVDSLFERVRNRPDVAGFTASAVPRHAGREYRAHGHDEALVRRAFQQSLDYYLSRSPADRARFPLAIAESYMGAGHLTEARAFLDSVSAAAPGNLLYVGGIGVVAALQGDTVAARDVMERLGAMEGPHLRGANIVWESRIAGVLGDCSEATNLLRTSLSRGQIYSNWAHRGYIYLGKARECTNLQAVLAPRE